MLAIVITLSGYLAGLHWLLNPPDPWQPNPKLAPRAAQQFAAKKQLPPIIKPVEAGGAPEGMTSAEPDTDLASIETSATVQASENETARTTEQNIAEATRPVAEPAHSVRREVSPTKTKPTNRKRIGRSVGRKLELMVLRTYERSDGKRFTRLLPINGARNALAYQPEE
jgi:hypothetical protein